MAVKEEIIDAYFEALFLKGAIYVWRFNGEYITQANITKHYHEEYYDTRLPQYSEGYYINKLKANEGKIGADCSGAFYPLSGVDRTAQGYYDDCVSKGGIATIDKTKSCMVFKGTPTTIFHIGFYNHETGCTIEMASSDLNCQKKALELGGWTQWGIPSFVESSEEETKKEEEPKKEEETPKVEETVYPKIVDVSAYNKNINYLSLKTAGISGAIIKFIRKDLNSDKMFEAHYNGFIKANVPVIGFYTYTYANTLSKAISDANTGVKTLGNKKGTVCFDVEDEVMKNLGSNLIVICNKVKEIYEKAGFNFIIYTGMSFYNSYFKPYMSQCNTKIEDFWIARYYKGNTVMPLNENPNQVYKPVDGIYGWQYTSKGNVNGYIGNIDLSVVYRDISKIVPVVPVIDTPKKDWLETEQEYMCIVTGNSALRIRTSPEVNDSNYTGNVYRSNETFQSTAVTSNGWWKTDLGYVSGKIARPVVGIVYNCNAVNVHKGSDTSNKTDIIDALKVNAKCAIRKKENNAYLINTSDGLIGYINSKYIKLT